MEAKEKELPFQDIRSSHENEKKSLLALLVKVAPRSDSLQQKRVEKGGSKKLNAIEAGELTKVFGKEIVAVKGISFAVEEGEIFGLLGPNGAGKTTTIRMVITLTKPTSGSITVFGLDALHKASDVRKLVGYVPRLISVDGRTHSLREPLDLCEIILCRAKHSQEGIRRRT